MLSRNIKNASGFTLVEIAIVLVIVGILIGSFIGTFASRIDTTRRDNTKKELDEIKTVLMAFAFSQATPYLPCPDTDVPPDGAENRGGGGVCAAATGFLPWQTIGTGYADAWGTRYRYWVNTDYANGAGFMLTTNDNNSATVETRVGNNNVAVLNSAVAVIYSHGKNGLGGISVDDTNRDVLPAVGNGYDDENNNADGDNMFMSRSPTKEGATITGGIFDDIVTWINSYELKAKMVEVGKMP
ncbi:MAG: type II secretion system protein [Gammaproteobacteria bacterium]